MHALLFVCLLMSPSSSATPPPANLVKRFVLVASGLLLLWFFGYEQTLATDGRFDKMLCSHIARSGGVALRAMGFSAGTTNPADPQLLYLAGKPAVWVGAPCNGLVLYALFAGFVLAYPGPWRRKLWYIPVGILFIYGLNVVRVAVLALNHQYSPGSMDFNHHYTFSFLVYAFIFGLWMLWARRLAGPLAAPVSDSPIPLHHA